MAIYRKGTVIVLTALLFAVVIGSVVHAVEVAPGVKVSGYMQNRLYLAPGANPTFRSERISISATAALPNESTAYVEWYYHPSATGSGLYLESAYYDTPIADGRLRIGKGRRLTFGITPAYPNRRTSNYGIFSETFTQDRIQGVQYVTQRGNLDFGISAHTALRLGVRNIGEIPGDTVRNADHQVPHLSLRDLPGDWSRKIEVASRIGSRWNNLRAGASLSVADLDNRDLDFLKANDLVPVTATDNDRLMWGLDFTYKPSAFVVQGEWADAEASDLSLDGWNILLGWEPPTGWKFFGRYAEKNIDVAPTTNPRTWDVEQIQLSAVQPLGKGLWLQYEYEINRESPPAGIGSVRNNLFFVELFTGF